MGILGQRFCNEFAESNLQMCEETKHIRDVQRNQMGVGLCFQQLICPSFSSRGVCILAWNLQCENPFIKTHRLAMQNPICPFNSTALRQFRIKSPGPLVYPPQWWIKIFGLPNLKKSEETLKGIFPLQTTIIHHLLYSGSVWHRFLMPFGACLSMSSKLSQWRTPASIFFSFVSLAMLNQQLL